VREAARVLGVSTTTVRKYCELGKLTAYTDNGSRIIISSRQLARMIRKFEIDYTIYRSRMVKTGWREVSKDESYSIHRGTLCRVRVGGNKWERWHNPVDEAEPPDTNMFMHTVFIVPMGNVEEDKVIDCD